MPMSAVFRPASYEAILRLPEHVTGEILAGDLYTQPRPSARHAQIKTGLASGLYGPTRASGALGGWLILVEPELHLGAHVLVPDLAGWRRERLPTTPDGAIDVVPDWICEILSPGTAAKDRKLKLPIYAALGVGHAWLVEPQAKTVEVFRSNGLHWILLAAFADQDVMHAEPFDTIPLMLTSLWDW